MPEVYINADEFMKDAKPCNDIKELEKVFSSEEWQEEIRKEHIRKAQDWVYLANKVVGAEGDDDGVV